MCVTSPDCWNESERSFGASTLPVDVTLSSTLPRLAADSVWVVAAELLLEWTVAYAPPAIAITTTTRKPLSSIRFDTCTRPATSGRRRCGRAAERQELPADRVRRRELRVLAHLRQHAAPRRRGRRRRDLRDLHAVVAEAREVRPDRGRVGATPSEPGPETAAVGELRAARLERGLGLRVRGEAAATAEEAPA